MHNKCGYTFDKHGCAGDITNQESKRLFLGFRLWHEHVEGGESDKKPGQRATQGDHEAFDEFASEVNN